MGFKARVLDFLVSKGQLGRTEADEITQLSCQSGKPIGELLEEANVGIDSYLATLSEIYGAPVVELTSSEIPSDVIDRVSARLVYRYRFIPVDWINGRLVIAVSDPSDLKMQDDLGRLLKVPIELRIADPDSIDKAIKTYYGVGAETIEQIIYDRDLEEAVATDHEEADTDISDLSVDASIIKFVNQMLLEAYRDRATDIHFEPFEDLYRVRIRIDGLLYDVPIPDSLRHFQNEIVSRVKIMADLNIAETRLPQDGRIKIRLGEDDIDLRVSILPLTHGESVNIRLLQPRRSLLSLQELGFSQGHLKIFERSTCRTHGIILVTGPTGSGKTTTLYAALDNMNSVERKIITIEDPVEYQLCGACQMQVKPKIGFDFASGLRSILRHDPDVILVGEIRDFETAELAIRASLTGHLVFSTLHTNDAPSSITRLQDIGIDSYLLSSSIVCVMAQRLVRVICDSCKQPCQPSAKSLEALGMNDTSALHGGQFFKGQGCSMCRNSGYYGRTAITEVLLMNDDIRRLIMEGAPANIIKATASEQGMETLRQDGWSKVMSGITTIDELLRVTQEDEEQR